MFRIYMMEPEEKEDIVLNNAVEEQEQTVMREPISYVEHKEDILEKVENIKEPEPEPIKESPLKQCGELETLLLVVKTSLETEELIKKIGVRLTPETIIVLNKLISLSPKTLTDIEAAIKEIIKDEKIDAKDIPNLIIIVQRIYQFIYSLKDTKFDSKKRAEITAISLKFIIHALVIERIIKIEVSAQPAFFMQTDILVDSCIGLLTFPKIIKPKKCLF